MNYVNLEKTARSSSKVTMAKNKVYMFIAAMLAYAVDNIPLAKSQALNPERLREFLATWKKISKDASLNHILVIEGPVIDQFNIHKDNFISAQVDMKLKSLNAAKPYLTDKELEQLAEAITTYETYIRSEVTRSIERTKLVPQPKEEVKATAKVE